MLENEKKIIPALGADWATRFYDPLVRIFTKEYPFKRALIKQANLNNQQTILDLACGTGTLSIGIKKRFPNINIYAVDADNKILEKAKTKALEKNYEIIFRQSFSDKLPFEDNKFDRVFSTLFFHHLTLDEKIHTLCETSRVLKPKGEFHIADYGKPSSLSQKLLSNVIKFIDGNETTQDNFKGRLEQLFVENNFSDVRNSNSFKTMLGTIYLFKMKKTNC